MFKEYRMNHCYIASIVIFCAIVISSATITSMTENSLNNTLSKLEYLGSSTNHSENSTSSNAHTHKLQEVPNTVNIPKIRKITKTDINVTLNEAVNLQNVNDSSGNTNKTTNGISTATTTTAPTTATKSKNIMKQVSENVYINVNQAQNNNVTKLEDGKSFNQSTNHILEKINSNNTQNVTILDKQLKNNITEIVLNKSNNSTTADVNSSSATPSVTSTTTTTIKSTTTTKTTTTPKPKKPLVTYGLEDFPNLEKNLLQQQKPILPELEPPKVQSSQEFSGNNFERDSYYIVPIVSIIFIVPLVMGILITVYRRFRDCWSTRHYRRMDFLVDGIYND